MSPERARHPKIAASLLVQNVLKKSLFVNELLNNSIDSFNYNERRFITELVYGTIRHLKHIDFWIEQALKKDITKINEEIRYLIRISVYQLLFMDNREDWAVIYEATELAKTTNKPRSAGFVNFILREIQRIDPSKKKMQEIIGNDRDKFLSTYYSFPEWLYTRLIEVVGSRHIESYLNLVNKPLGITLRVEGDKERIKKILYNFKKKKIVAEKAAISPYGIYTDRAVNYNMIKKFGDVFIQDESSQLAVLDLDLKEGDTVLDLCASPGGKSLFMSYLVGDSGKVIASDVNRHRLHVLSETIVNHNKKNVEVKLQDAAVFREEWENKFKKVLLDAPCSALGTIRRHPDVKWLKTDQDPPKMARLASKILENAARYVTVDGILLFAVCTFTREETTKQIQNFITNHNNFRVEKGYYTISSIRDNRDAFFITRLRRVR